MQNPHPAKRRVIALLVFFGAFLLLFAAVLYDAQILHGGENRAKSISSNAASETVTASRGIITDRNGKVLVSNRLAYTLVFDRSGFDDDAALNAAILRLVQLCEETGTGWNDTLPIGRVGNFLRYSHARSETFDKFIEKNDLTSGASGRQLLSELRELYHVDESLSEREARLIVGDFILHAARLRGRRGRFAARFGRGRRHGGRRGGRGGGRFGRGRGHGLVQLVEDIALAAALDAHIRPVFAVDLADGDDGQYAAFFQRFELVALFVGQLAQVGLLAGLKPAVFRLLVFGGGIFTKRDGGRQREQRRERAQTRDMLNRFHGVLSCAARAAHSQE